MASPAGRQYRNWKGHSIAAYSRRMPVTVGAGFMSRSVPIKQMPPGIRRDGLSVRFSGTPLRTFSRLNPRQRRQVGRLYRRPDTEIGGNGFFVHCGCRKKSPYRVRTISTTIRITIYHSTRRVHRSCRSPSRIATVPLIRSSLSSRAILETLFGWLMKRSGSSDHRPDRSRFLSPRFQGNQMEKQPPARRYLFCSLMNPFCSPLVCMPAIMEAK